VSTFVYERVRDLKAWSMGKPGEVREYDSARLSDAPWVFIPMQVEETFARIADAFPSRLPDQAEILVGAQTSADKVYLLKPSTESRDVITVEKDGKTYQIERGILKPGLLNVQIRSFEQPVPNAFMLFPYTIRAGARVRGGHVGDVAELIPPAVMRAKYPDAWKYLSAHKVQLLGRDRGQTPEDAWYQYGRSQNLTKFDGDKIVVQVLAERPRYGYDTRGLMMTGGGNGPYYFIKTKTGAQVSLLAILAVLNHPLTEAMVRSRGSDFRGGYFSRKKAVLNEVVLPFDLTSAAGQEVHAEVVKQARALVQSFSAPESLSSRQLVVRERKKEVGAEAVEKLITEAFGLSDAEVDGLVDYIADATDQDAE